MILQNLWVTKCRGLLLPDEPGKLDLEAKFEELYRLFPAAKKWLDWWAASDIQAMLFPARKRMPQDDPPMADSDEDDDQQCEKNQKSSCRRPELPTTTNAQESMHRVYYLIW